MRSLCIITALAFTLVASAAEEGASAAGGYTVARFDVPSTAVGSAVPTSALLHRDLTARAALHGRSWSGCTVVAETANICPDTAHGSKS